MEDKTISLLHNINNNAAELNKLNNLENGFFIKAKKPPGATFNLWLAVIILCIGSSSIGLTCGYTSPALASIQRSDTPLTTEEIGWFGSLVPLGALCGGLIAGFMIDALGRKGTVVFTSVPFLVGWLIIAFASSVNMLYIGRALCGLCIGIMSLVIPVYIGEIAPADQRGVMGSCFQLSINVALIVVFPVGVFINHTQLAMFCAAFPVLLILGMMLVPESPNWLFMKERRDKSVKGLKWLLGKHADISTQLAEMEDCLKQKQESNLSCGDIFSAGILKPLIIGMFLMFFQQFSGINAVMFYVALIFDSAGTGLDPDISSILMVVVMFVATFGSLFLIERLGRIILLQISAAFMIVSLYGVALYFYLHTNTPELAAKLGLLPLISLLVYGVAFSVGYGSVPWVVMGEIFPSKAKGFACSLCTALNWTSCFVVTKYFAILIELVGNHGAYIFFAKICLASILFVWAFVPETKGKSLQDIEKHFKGQK